MKLIRLGLGLRLLLLVMDPILTCTLRRVPILCDQHGCKKGLDQSGKKDSKHYAKRERDGMGRRRERVRIITRIIEREDLANTSEQFARVDDCRTMRFRINR